MRRKTFTTLLRPYVILNCLVSRCFRWAQLYFVAWYLISVILIINLFVALILEVSSLPFSVITHPNLQLANQKTVSPVLISCDIKGVFHYAKDSANFGRKSTGKVRFGSFLPEYSGSPLEVMSNIPTEICRSMLTNWLIAFLCREFGKGTKQKKVARAIPLGWPGLIGKCRSIFLGYSHWSLAGGSGIMESIPGH